MRVLVNELQALKAKTGIGHYTGELLRACANKRATTALRLFPALG